MVIDNLKLVLIKNKDIANREYLRNLLKEELQLMVLNFIYTNSKYKNLIFTGGTALRKFYGLGRLSEDLDFDLEDKNFDINKFDNDLIKHFKSNLQYKEVYSKVKNNTVFLKFPVLREVGYAGLNDSEVLILRIDTANSYSKSCVTETKLFDSSEYSFVARVYDFPTLVANKIVAFLTRIYKRGQFQEIDFKGRDAFDVVWMFGELTKNKMNVNLKRINEFIKVNSSVDLKRLILKKAKTLKSDDLCNDLRNFFQNDSFVRQFCDNYYDLLKSSINIL